MEYATLYKQAFQELGKRYKTLRKDRKMVQEDVLEHGFSVRHYQQLESGRPHSLSTLFRLAEMFHAEPADILKGLTFTPRKRPREK